MNKISILCFGDSITRGAFDEEAGGWVDRLKVIANDTSIKNDFKPVVSVFNMGIGGNTTVDLLKRFKFETEQRFKSNNDLYFIFSVGVNDLAFITGENKQIVPLDDFNVNLTKLVAEAREFSNNIIFLTILPVVENLTNSINVKGVTREIKDIEIYNRSIRDICHEENLDVIDVYTTFDNIANYKNFFASDGLHPNALGHKMILNAVFDYFNKKEILK